jgi:hypothetical protein
MTGIGNSDFPISGNECSESRCKYRRQVPTTLQFGALASKRETPADGDSAGAYGAMTWMMAKSTGLQTDVDRLQKGRLRNPPRYRPFVC